MKDSSDRRKCIDCKLEKDKEEYYVRSSKCRSCSKKYNKQYWEKNRPRILEQSGEYRRKNRTKINDTLKTRRKKLDEIKMQIGCMKCGIKDYRVLEFHHRNPAEKAFNIGTSVGRKWEKILLEVDKCIVLCSNCHSILHHEERNGGYIYHTGTD